MKFFAKPLIGVFRHVKTFVDSEMERLEAAASGRSVRSSGRIWLRDVRIPSLFLDAAVAGLLVLQSRFYAADFFHFISLTVYSVGMYGVFVYAVSLADPEIRSETSSYTLLIFLLLVNLYTLFIAEIYGAAYIFSTTAVVFTAAMLFPKKVVSVFAVFSLLVCRSFLPMRHWYFLPGYVLSSFAAIILASPVTSRKAVISAGFKLSLVNTLIFAFGKELFGLKSDVGMEIYYALGSGLAAAAAGLIALPYLEAIFGRMSPITLVEMSDTNKPLMKRMMVDAPGTYHHSLITASLAEAACEAIGASGPLARVGAYYHDIGKLFKPEYFIENQIYTGNPHDTVSPTMSSMVLMAHVKEGLELARRHKLNPKIVEFIGEHHGESLILQFYHKAVTKDVNVEERDFRYDGTRPRSRETAVVMLADSVEAMSRSLTALKPSAIADTVKKVVNNKFVDGQLNDAPLTLKDLEIIAEVMTRTLCGILHVRYQKSDDEPPRSAVEAASAAPPAE